MIAMDIFYIKKWSLSMDIAILLKTFPVLGGQVVDAYHRWRARARLARQSASMSKNTLNSRNGYNKVEE
jgi:hypothetical protein